ncbi:MAG: hypothetical protein LLF98_02000 [Clostridium sp.]|uniref:hypothetical protein n=1 Tax=Clostridium sp. TaxID=1506 RepID=UPI0025C071CF|nr:hypothetical protein [Clostridium sp.]MCE5220054.1 hypothetical protein [Clostridium sp.]
MSLVDILTLKGYWKNVSDWVKGTDTVSSPKITLAGSNSYEVVTLANAVALTDTTVYSYPLGSLSKYIDFEIFITDTHKANSALINLQFGVSSGIYMPATSGKNYMARLEYKYSTTQTVINKITSTYLRSFLPLSRCFGNPVFYSGLGEQTDAYATGAIESLYKQLLQTQSVRNTSLQFQYETAPTEGALTITLVGRIK